MSAEYHFQAGIKLVGQQDEAVILVFAQIVLLTVGTFEAETFQVRVILLVGII